MPSVTSVSARPGSVAGIGAGVRRNQQSGDRLFATLFLLPALLCLVAVVAYPVVWNLVTAFTNISLVYPNWRFVAFGNFATTLTDADFLWSTLRTLIWTIVSVGLQLVLGFIAAISLERVTHGRTALRMLLIIPWAFPAIVMSFVWRFMLDANYGVTNWLLMTLGLVSEPHAWFGETGTAMAALIFMNVWFGFPFMMVAILAGLQTISADLYEAARIDGASPWQEFIYVTVPGLRGILATLVTLRTIWVFNNFEFPFLTTGGGPVDATTTLPVYAFKIGWSQFALGRMAAVSVLMLVILAAATLFYLRILGERDDG